MASHTSTAPADGAHVPSTLAALGAALRDITATVDALEAAYRGQSADGDASPAEALRESQAPNIGRDLVDLHDSLDRVARRCAGVSLAVLSLTPETREPLTMLLEDLADSIAGLGEKLGVIRAVVNGG